MRVKSEPAETASTSSPETLTDSERRLITVLALHGQLAKRDLSAKTGLSWATVVKIVGRFERCGIVRRTGTAPRDAVDGGKSAYLYRLEDGYGHVLGIDVEYSRTRLVAKALSGAVARSMEIPSPNGPSLKSFLSFLAGSIEAMDAGIPGRLLGIGVGMPLWMVRGGATLHREVFRRVEEALAGRYRVPTRVHNNIRAYATNLAHKSNGAGDFLLVTIRTGLGFGMYLGGDVIRGSDGLAGEMAHMQIDPDGLACRCGRRGCLETVVNENAIVRDYCARKGCGASTLSEIAGRAARGDQAAVSVLENAASRLAVAVSAVILLLDIPEIVLAAAFGREGRVFTGMLERHLKNAIFPHPGLRVRYDSLDSDGFLHGAALLVLRDYYDYEVASPG